MPGFRRRGQTVEIKLRSNEATALQTLAFQLAQLVGELTYDNAADAIEAILAALDDDQVAADHPALERDPALRRLFPDAYTNDPAASSEFRRFTQPDQAAAKVTAARCLADDIAQADEGWVEVPPDHVDAWLTTLTNLRLVLATRLGIEAESDEPAADDEHAPLAAIYDWCGWLLESLLTCL